MRAHIIYKKSLAIGITSKAAETGLAESRGSLAARRRAAVARQYRAAVGLAAGAHRRDRGLHPPRGGAIPARADRLSGKAVSSRGLGP